MRAASLLAVFAVSACAHAPAPGLAEGGAGQALHEQTYVPPTGSNEIFRESTGAAPGHELILADLSLPADAVSESHYHPWEEYLYVIAGSAVVDIEGQDERVVRAGESFVIPRGKVHTPRAGPTGVRAIVVRVHDQGDPVAIAAPR